MKFLNGWKTIIGVAGTVVTLIWPHLDPEYAGGIIQNANSVVLGAFGLLTAFGVVHKIEKSGR